jgi:hypothetical protein
MNPLPGSGASGVGTRNMTMRPQGLRAVNRNLAHVGACWKRERWTPLGGPGVERAATDWPSRCVGVTPRHWRQRRWCRCGHGARQRTTLTRHPRPPGAGRSPVLMPLADEARLARLCANGGHSRRWAGSRPPSTGGTHDLTAGRAQNAISRSSAAICAGPCCDRPWNDDIFRPHPQHLCPFF